MNATISAKKVPLNKFLQHEKRFQVFSSLRKLGHKIEKKTDFIKYDTSHGKMKRKVVVNLISADEVQKIVEDRQKKYEKTKTYSYVESARIFKEIRDKIYNFAKDEG